MKSTGPARTDRFMEITEKSVLFLTFTLMATALVWYGFFVWGNEYTTPEEMRELKSIAMFGLFGVAACFAVWAFDHIGLVTWVAERIVNRLVGPQQDGDNPDTQQSDSDTFTK